MTVKSHDTLWWSVTFFKGFLSVPKWSRQLTKNHTIKIKADWWTAGRGMSLPREDGWGEGWYFAAKVSFFPCLCAAQIFFLLKSSLFQMNLYQWLRLQPSTFFNSFFSINPQKLEGVIPFWQFLTNNLENNVVVNNLVLIGKSTWGISGQHRFFTSEADPSVMFW